MRTHDGYPDSWGAQRASVFPHAGPSSYSVVTYGPLAGGDIALYAVVCGASSVSSWTDYRGWWGSGGAAGGRVKNNAGETPAQCMPAGCRGGELYGLLQ